MEVNDTERNYWLYAPGNRANKWDEFYDKGIIGIGWDSLGDLSKFNSKDEIVKAMKKNIDPNKTFRNDSLATWQFANEMKPGDIVYAKKGRNKIVGKGIITSDYYFDPSRNQYKNLRKINWTNKGEWEAPRNLDIKTLTKINRNNKIPEILDRIIN